MRRRPTQARFFRACSVAYALALIMAGGCAPSHSLAAQQSAFPAPEAQQTAVEIAFLDVGQGDAALITAPDGRHVLIDGGPRGSGVAAWLRSRGIDTLELVVASHNHADHIGGLEEVLATVGVRYYMENDVPSATQTYARLVDAVARSGAVVLKAEQRAIGLGDLRIHVLPSPPGALSHNDRSIGLVVRLGEFHAMFTGDAERETLAWWIEHAALPRMSIVKVSHHGARSGTTAAFVHATSPDVAVISVGAPNQYGHPSPITLNMWRAAARYVLRTDREGPVTVIGAADGSMRLSTSRGTPPLRDVPIAARSAVSALEGRR
jgi:competence protein ComEC